jgi:hypothetical protein
MLLLLVIWEASGVYVPATFRMMVQEMKKAVQVRKLEELMKRFSPVGQGFLIH